MFDSKPLNLDHKTSLSVAFRIIIITGNSSKFMKRILQAYTKHPKAVDYPSETSKLDRRTDPRRGL